jgi:putative transcriptional regulator
MPKRNLFAELRESLTEAKAHEEGKMTLKTISVTPHERRILAANEIRAVREKYNMSRAVFASFLHISPRTLEKWEQGTSHPNEQASTLIALTDRYPDMFERLAEV